MKITVYTIPDCQFSRQEKEYLASHTLMYDEKNLEANKEFLTEMLAISSNFAGTPVTKIEKDDGQITVLKGFTKEEFDRELGFEAKPAEVPVAPIPVVETPPASVDNPLNSVLNTLEQKSEPAPVVPPTPIPPTPPTPVVPEPVVQTPTPAIPSSPPSIPDFKPQ